MLGSKWPRETQQQHWEQLDHALLETPPRSGEHGDRTQPPVALSGRAAVEDTNIITRPEQSLQFRPRALKASLRLHF